jgi:hypothetical protein
LEISPLARRPPKEVGPRIDAGHSVDQLDGSPGLWFATSAAGASAFVLQGLKLRRRPQTNLRACCRLPYRIVPQLFSRHLIAQHRYCALRDRIGEFDVAAKKRLELRRSLNDGLEFVGVPQLGLDPERTGNLRAGCGVDAVSVPTAHSVRTR